MTDLMVDTTLEKPLSRNEVFARANAAYQKLNGSAHRDAEKAMLTLVDPQRKATAKEKKEAEANYRAARYIELLTGEWDTLQMQGIVAQASTIQHKLNEENAAAENASEEPQFPTLARFISTGIPLHRGHFDSAEEAIISSVFDRVENELAIITGDEVGKQVATVHRRGFGKMFISIGSAAAVGASVGAFQGTLNKLSSPRPTLSEQTPPSNEVRDGALVGAALGAAAGAALGDLLRHLTITDTIEAYNNWVDATHNSELTIAFTGLIEHLTTIHNSKIARDVAAFSTR